MESIEVEVLLEKYFNTETTLQEENLLKEYFLSEYVAEHLEQYRPMFNYFAQSKTEELTKEVNLNTIKKVNWKWLSIAASIVLIFSVYNGYQYMENERAKIAFQETHVAFQLLAKNLNKGAGAVMYLDEYESTTNKVFK